MERRLSAIFAADMVGYSRLMEADEVDTLQRQKSHRVELINPTIEEFHGRIVKEMGDGVLVEFPSVVEAVQCAVSIQREMAIREAEVSEDRRIVYRVGINLGDIVIDEDDIFGDGVNIAARLEQLAEPGGICISGTAYDQLLSKIDVGYESLGNVRVKNIERPIRAYKVLIDPDQVSEVIAGKRPERAGIYRFAAMVAIFIVVIIGGGTLWWSQQPDFEPVNPASMEFELPDKPSIAVLPFDNLSGDSDQDYFSDGLTEDIITKLSSFSNLFVIGRNSTGKYQDKGTDVRVVAQDLGVRYVLQGSVRRSGNSVRISAQLIDALNGVNLWAEKYDHELANIFQLQDEITKQVTTRLASNIVEAEFQERTRGGTRNLKAYDYFLRGWQAILVVNPKSNARAIGMFEEAIKEDPEYARAYAGLAMARANNASFHWGQGPKDSFENAIALAKKAVNHAPDDQLTHRMLAGVLRYRGDFDKAIEAYEQALARSPSNPDVLIALAFTNALAGHGPKAVQIAKTAMRLNPYPPPHYFAWQGISYYVSERFEEAAKLFEQFSSRNPKFFLGYFWAALGQAQLGNMSGAELHRQELLRLRPEFTIKTVLDQNQAKGVARKLILEGARKAGIPDKQSPKLPDKPSIAVLPFNNMSDDPQQEYFSDGITEDLITDLSQVSGLFVIARNSSFTYKGKSVNVPQIGRELGVSYVIEGSIRKQGDRVRINAQLIDVQTGGHLWAQRYDRNLTDVFALQDEVVKKIVSALAVTLNPREQEQLAHSSPVTPQAYDKLLRGLEKFRRFTAETNLEAREYFEQAIAIDPAFARAHADLALTYAVEAEQQWTNDPERSAQRGLEIANHALSLDDSIREVHFVLSIVYRGLKRMDESIMSARKAIKLSPNYADGHTTLALSLNYAGSHEEGLAVITRAMKLNPLRPFFYVWTEGQSHYLQGNYKMAVQLFEHVITTNPQFSAAQKMLVATYIELGRKDDAEWAFEELLTIAPEFKISTENIRVPYIKEAVRRRYIESLRQANTE